MHAKSGLRVLLKWKIYRPDSVIAAVMSLIQKEHMPPHLFVKDENGDTKRYTMPETLTTAGQVYTIEKWTIHFSIV